MPSPIAHAVVGWVLQRTPALAPSPTPSGGARPIAFILGAAGFFSLLPDLPSLAGFIAGDLKAFHNNWEHSLFGALLAAVAAGAIAWWARLGSRGRWFSLALCCYGAHVVMDYFTVGRGVMLLWPLSAERYTAPVKLFYGLHWSDGWSSARHLWTAATEAAFVALLVFLLRWRRARWRSSGAEPGMIGRRDQESGR